VLPQALVEQLASPGRMFIPVGTDMQYIMHIDKDAEGKVTETQVMGVQVSGSLLLNLDTSVLTNVFAKYVPLTDRKTK